MTERVHLFDLKERTSASRSPLAPQPRRKRTGPANLAPGELDDRLDDI